MKDFNAIRENWWNLLNERRRLEDIVTKITVVAVLKGMEPEDNPEFWPAVDAYLEALEKWEKVDKEYKEFKSTK